MLTPKIDTTKVFWAIWTDRSDLSYDRSDQSRQVCQITNWTAPLRRSHRDDRNAYIERPIWSMDEGVMPPGRPAALFDRSRVVRPVQRPVRNAQSELGVVF